jgi:hypothetical protein
MADRPVTGWVLAGLALALSAVGARPYASGFNDASRLAAAESLIDRGTLVIDDSIFVRPPPELIERGLPPFTPELQPHVMGGTADKVHVGGHYYSDKSMVSAILLAGVYRPLVAAGLPRPGDRPDVFCRLAVVLTCGLAYAAAVGCLWSLGRRAGLGPGWRLVWLAAFALATVLPAYSREVSGAMPQTGAVAVLALCLARVADGTAGRRVAWGSAAGAGLAAGLGYSMELGAGPPLVLAGGAAIAVRTRSVWALGAFALGALPFVGLHHAVNYAIGGTWVPLNMVPEYLAWPNSPFSRANMTGVSHHDGPVELAVYAGALLVGGDGILVYNLPLLLAVAAGWLVLVRPGPYRVELVALTGWCTATWALYAALSNNYGGGGVSVRWFVPFLVPGMWALARLLAERPGLRPDFLALTGWGLLLGALLWPSGAWPNDVTRWLWPIFGAALCTWALVRAGAWGSGQKAAPPNP